MPMYDIIINHNKFADDDKIWKLDGLQGKPIKICDD